MTNLMPDRLKKLIFTCIAVCTAMISGYAQPKSTGLTFSLSGIGIIYEHTINEECFINADIKAEMGETFLMRQEYPGISASFSCNFIMKEWVSRGGETICAFAGPGISFGLSHDLDSEFGYSVGLKGRVGIECCFERDIAISVTLNPIIGSHLSLEDGIVNMKYYRNGLINAILPEIGIKYIF